MTQAAAADLEIGLHRRGAEGYAVELRFSLPDSDADVRLVPARPAPIEFDAARLQELALDHTGYGRHLSQGLFSDPAVRAAFARARSTAQALGAPLRLRLFVGPSAPELHRLRWEALRDPDDDSLLLTGEQVLFSRYLSSLDWRPVRLRPRSALRALVVVANPADLAAYGLAPLDAHAEAARVRAALRGVHTTPLTGAGQAGLDRLSAELRDGYDVLYLLCHGALVGGEPRLWLEQADGSSDVVAGSDLVERLRELRERPRLVVLASCEGAGAGDQPLDAARSEDALTALGPRLAEAGLPAVLAMHGRVTVETVARFMPVLFTELLRDGQIDRAVAAARGAVRERPDCWMPVLFLRLKSGRIWYVPGFAGDRPGFEQWPALARAVRQGRCTPIIGPGVLESLLGSTQDIARRWAETYHYPMAPHNREELPQVAQYLAVNQGERFPRDELAEYLLQELLTRYGRELPASAQASPPADGRQGGALERFAAVLTAVAALAQARDPTEPHRVLAQLPFPLYLTTNPDPLLELALEAEGKRPHVALCPWNDFVERSLVSPAAEAEAEPEPRRPLVYHLFGRLGEPDSLVLTEDDYFDYLIGVTSNNDLIPEAVRLALTDTSLLFLGFRLDDWAFRVLFRSIVRREGGSRRRRYAHVAVQIDPEEGRFLEPERARRYLQTYFQGDDIRIYWGRTEDFVRELLAHWPADAPPEARSGAADLRGPRG